MTRWVAGVDGCRAGWAVVLRDVDDPTRVRCRTVSSFSSVLDLDEAPVAIAIDIPIGIPARADRGGRACDVLARRAIKPRGSCVFPAPSRVALAHRGTSHAEASRAQRKDSGRGISQQLYAILPKIAEVDDAMTPALQARVIEVHPELSFFALAGEVVLSKKSEKAGRAERRKLLSAAMGPHVGALAAPSGAAEDDILDAAVASWTAERFLASLAIPLETSPARDPRGLKMEMWR